MAPPKFDIYTWSSTTALFFKIDLPGLFPTSTSVLPLAFGMANSLLVSFVEPPPPPYNFDY